jgi:hypothetical protein
MEEFCMNALLDGARFAMTESKAALRLYFEPLAWCFDVRRRKAKTTKEEALTFKIPAHAYESPVPRDDPYYQKVIAVSAHGHPEELQLRGEIEGFLATYGKTVRVQYGIVRDAGLYLIVTIGVGIATSLITDLIKYLAKRLRDDCNSRRKPVVFISSSYAPKRVFRLPEEENEAREHFRRHLSQDKFKKKTRGSNASPDHFIGRPALERHQSAPRKSIDADRLRPHILAPILWTLARIMNRLIGRDR